jgi:hypothetical protein
MKYWVVAIGVLLSAHALAGSTSPEIPLNQKLAVVDYFDNGRQSGCGLRATGETKDNVWLNVLITVFMKETGAAFGVIKVVARKVNMKDGVPLLHDGKITYANIGNIRKAWIKSYSGKEPLIYKNGESSHGDAYMVTADFSSTVDLIAEILQDSFKIGLNRTGDGPDEVYQFNKQLDQDEGYKLSVCMKNLRTAMDENKDRQNF